MNKTLKLPILILMTFAAFFSCSTSKDEKQDERMMQGTPLPRINNESMDLLVKLDMLTEIDDSDLALSDSQVATILPVLEEWYEAINDESATDAAPFASTISGELSEEQLAFSPSPEQGEGHRPPEDGQGGGPQGGGRPSGGPGGGPGGDSGSDGEMDPEQFHIVPFDGKSHRKDVIISGGSRSGGPFYLLL